MKYTPSSPLRTEHGDVAYVGHDVDAKKDAPRVKVVSESTRRPGCSGFFSWYLARRADGKRMLFESPLAAKKWAGIK